jgi:hypothetical protein
MVLSLVYDANSSICRHRRRDVRNGHRRDTRDTRLYTEKNTPTSQNLTNGGKYTRTKPLAVLSTLVVKRLATAPDAESNLFHSHTRLMYEEHVPASETV